MEAHGWKKIAWLAFGLVCLIGSGPVFGQFPPTMWSSDLAGWDGFIVHGAPGESVGGAISGAGDINADGIDDFVLQAGSGAYLVYGREGGFPASFDASTVDGTSGAVLTTKAPIWGLSPAGDVNGDGIDDLLIRPGYIYRYKIVVLFGSTELPASIDLDALDGTRGFLIRVDGTFSAAADAGDVNGDGIGDVIIGARESQPAGAAYVVLGNSDGFPASLAVEDLDGTDGFQLNGAAPWDAAGSAVSGAGDVNGDGLDDIVIGAPGADPDGIENAGSTYVVFGRGGGFPPSIELSTLDGTDGFAAISRYAGVACGTGVSAAGDINGDGLDDVVLGAPGPSSGGTAYVVFGANVGYDPILDLATLDGANGFGVYFSDVSQFAAVVSTAGDMNHDGLDDVVVAGDGRCLVVFGRPSGFGAWESYDRFGERSFEIVPTTYYAPRVGKAGDVNGDGFTDLCIAGTGSGGVPVIYGRSSCRRGTINVGAAIDSRPADVLFVNGASGGVARTVVAAADDRMWAGVVPPPQGGSARFVIHANLEPPTGDSITELADGVGTACFPMTLPAAAPAAVWSRMGKDWLFGSSRYFDGTPIQNPDRAPTYLFYMARGDATNLPPGTVITFQGLMIDPGSASPRGLSATNGVTLVLQ